MSYITQEQVKYIIKKEHRKLNEVCKRWLSLIPQYHESASQSTRYQIWLTFYLFSNKLHLRLGAVALKGLGILFMT